MKTAMWSALVFILVLMGTAQALEGPSPRKLQPDYVFLDARTKTQSLQTQYLISRLSLHCNEPTTSFDEVVQNGVEDVNYVLRFSEYNFDFDMRDLAEKQLAYATALSNALRERIIIIADFALKRHCLDIADKYYRKIVVIFTGSTHAAVRQRAQIGVDDVRSRRSSNVR